jgi:hypothetical protein
MAGRRTVAELAAHHQLLEPRIDLDGRAYVRAGRRGYRPLWRFAAVVSQTLGVWVKVSGDEAAAAWLAPSPPGSTPTALPITVSPRPGSRRMVMTTSSFRLPTTVTLTGRA